MGGVLSQQDIDNLLESLDASGGVPCTICGVPLPPAFLPKKGKVPAHNFCKAKLEYTFEVLKLTQGHTPEDI